MITIPIWVFVILITLSVFFILIFIFELFVYFGSLKVQHEYEKGQLKRYGTREETDD